MAGPRQEAHDVMTDSPSYDANRWRRFDDWDNRPLRQDQFAVEDPENGFSAFAGAADPRPGLTIMGGQVTEMDGVPAEEFDMIDAFIATYHIDPTSPRRRWRSPLPIWHGCWWT